MKTVYQIFVRITDGLTVITGWVAALCLVAAALIVTEAVIVRKLMGISTIWQIEASVFLLIFTSFYQKIALGFMDAVDDPAVLRVLGVIGALFGAFLIYLGIGVF